MAPIRIGTLVVSAFLALPVQAQDYRLPPSMQGKPSSSKPDVDYRVPGSRSSGPSTASGAGGLAAVKIDAFNCKVTLMQPGASSGRGSAGGGLRNVSSETLQRVEVEIEWTNEAGMGVMKSRARAQTLPLAPRQASLFNSAVAVPAT